MKWTTIAAMLMFASPALAQQASVTITLSQEQLQVVWAGLQELPGKFADPVKAELQKQLAAEAKKASEPKKDK